MMPWSVTITKGENGFRLSWDEEIDDGTVISKEEYVQEPDDCDERETEAKVAVNLCWAILGHFGIYGSKHDHFRPVIKLEHGANWECEGCEVCQE